MRNTLKLFRTFKPTALSVAMAVAFGNAVAQDNTAQELVSPDSTVSIGAGIWSGDRHQQGIYDGMREDKAYGLLDIDINKRDDATGTWLILNGRNLGLDTRELKAEWLRQGDIGASIEYSRTPRDNPLTFTTGLQGLGSANLTLSGAGASALPSREVSLGTVRDLTQLGFYKSFSQVLDLKVSFKNEEKNGTRQWGLGSNPYFLAEPIDNTTRQFEAILNFTGEKLQLSGGYYGSWFDNGNSLVSARINGVANSAPSANPANPTPLSLPLDNQSHQLFLNGGYAFTPTTRGTFKMSYGTATQDETLPVAFNVIPRAGSPTHLDGKINTTVAEVGLTSRPLPKLSLLANLRYQDVNDKTPVAQYINAVYNTPHSITTKSGKVEATYRLPAGFSLTGGLDYKDQDRSAPTVGILYVPFRKQIDETTYRLQLRRGLSETVNGSLAYLHSKRDGSSYVLPGDQYEDAINPLHIADRKRDKWRGMLDWSPTDKLSLQFAVEDARDKYQFNSAVSAAPADQPQGVKHGSANLYSVDASYTFNEFWQVNAWYSLDVAKMKELGFRAASGGAANAQKIADLKETGDTFGLGLKGQISSKLKFGANLEFLKTFTRFDQAINPVGAGATFPTSGGVTEQPLSNITNKMTRLKIFAEYALNKSSDLRFDAIHERWHTNDWTWAFANGAPFVFGTTVDGTMVTAKPIQSATFVGARYIYKFQ
jgi:MtrB/PioB family decaheme-associated outer membrane protein